MAFKEYKGEIIPFGFEEEAIEKILDYEGGYNAKDPVTGKPVKYGIDQKANPDIDVSNITKEDAKEIYRNRYWNPSGAGALPKDLALVHFDATVNQGNMAKRFLEESGGDVNKYLDLRRQHYIQLATDNPEKYGSSLKGWLNRLDKVEKDLANIERPQFKEYDGEILPLEGKKKPEAEPILSPEEQVISQIGADTTGGIQLSDYGKLFGAGAVKGTLGAPEAIEAGAQGLARDTIFKPTEVLEYLADPEKLQQAVANAFGFKMKEKRGETPLTDLKEKQQVAVDQVLTRGKIPQLADLTEIGQSISNYIEDSVTPEMKQALAESQPTGNLIEAFNTGDFSKVSLGEKPSFAGLAGQAARVFGTSAPAILTAIVTKSPTIGGTFAFGQAGSEGVDEAKKYIGEMSFDELNEKSEYFRNLVVLGYSPEQAKEMTIAKAGNTAAYMQGIVGALGNQFTANLLTGKLSNAKLLAAKTTAGRISKAVAAGALEDGFQETAEGIATDLGIDKTVVREIGVDSFANLVLGAIGGGGPGFVGGIKGELDRRSVPPEEVKFREATPEELESIIAFMSEDQFAGAPSIEITGVGEVPGEAPAKAPSEAPAATQDIAAMMAELEEKAPQPPVEEPKIEEPEVKAKPKAEAPKVEEGKAVSFKDMTPEDQKTIRKMEADKNKIAREKKLFPEFLKRQGIQPSEKSDLGLEKFKRPGIFKNSAPSFDELTSRAISEGFMVDTGDDVQNVAQFREYVSDYLNSGVIRTGPDAAREGQINAIDEAIARIYRKYEEPEFGLEETTPEQLRAQEEARLAEQEEERLAEQQRQKDQERREIAQLSERAAEDFQLGRTAEEDLMGQTSMFEQQQLTDEEIDAEMKALAERSRVEAESRRREDDPDADIPFFSMPAREQTKTEAFKKWFGDSKVVNPDGSPMIVYHGTTKDFDKFAKTVDIGFHFGTIEQANNRNIIDRFWSSARPKEGSNVMPVYIKLENPLRVKDLKEDWDLGLLREMVRVGVLSEEKMNALRQEGNEKQNWKQLATRTLRELGYDGLVYENVAEGRGDSYVVLNPKQVKSAIGNRGTFSPDDSNILYSVAKKKLPPGRNAELAEAAQRLRDGNITKREYDDIVKRLDPSKLYAEVPAPASDAKMLEALDVNKREKIRPQIADGQRVGTRLDIPAARKGAFVVSIHQPRTPSKVGQVIGYDSTAVLNDVVFATGNEKKALEIASGGAKDVLQTIEGSWQNVSPAEAERMAKEAIDSPEWIQVGVNPTRHSYFYDRDTMEPVVQADQIIQIGNLVLAKNPVNASKESFLFSAPQDLLAKQDERIREELRDEKITELKSVKQRMAAIERRFAEKKLKPLDQDIYAQLNREAKALEEAILDLYEPNMTPEAFLAAAAKSLANKKDGITQDVYDVIHSMFKKNPKLLDGLRLSVSTFPGDRSPEGEFKPYKRMVYLYKGTSGLTDPRVIMHEINHSLEQMMPREARKAVVKHWREALEKAAKSEKSPNGIKFFDSVNAFIRNPNRETFNNAIKAMPDESYYQYINPSEYWAVNSEILMQSYLGGAWQRFKTSVKAFFEALKNVLGMPNRWIIYKAFDQAINGERKSFSQMNDYIRGVVPMYSIHRNIAGGPAPLAAWTSPDESKIADWIYKLQDKFIDVKDVQKAILEEVESIDDRFNAYMKEELYHGRTAKRIEDFLRYELLPIVKKIRNAGIEITEFDEFLHMRHAPERNAQIAKVNPAMPDAGSGVSTADAKKYMADLDPKKRAAMEKIANDIDNMVKGTQQLLVDYGLEEQSTIDQWNKTYKNYVPLMRDDLDFAHSVTGLGQGLATRGKTSKRATGSLKDVVDIFANLAIQRERAIIRGEKSRVGRALYGLAIQNPNGGFWLPVNPDAIKDPEGLLRELIDIGLTPQDAANFIKEPYTQDIDPRTGLVTRRINVNNRYADNVFSVRVNGKDRFIFFNPSDPRAMRMVKSLKNMDAEQFSGIVGNVAKVTRFIASVNTQYNPVFGAWNFTRDIQGAAFNLSTTPIAGKQKEVMAGVLPAWLAVYRDLRAERKGKKADGEWVDLFERFEKAGAKTGYRDQFAQTRKKANIIEREMAHLNRGNVRKVAGAVMDWLSDYNDAMENAVRLSAFKVALDQGLSEEQAASLAKNLTVNFNRKGAWSQGFAALYAFFNASVQGSARILETLRGPAGKKIIAGGMLLGVFQAVALMMAGFDEDEPPEFLKDKNLLIPYGDGKYAIIPMPLGFSAIPSTGRRITEMVMYGGNIPKKVVGLMGMWMDAFNPMGSGSFAQMLSPTSVDPFVSADMNRDSFGRPIYKKDKETNPSPGYERSREGASDFSKGLSYILNYITSGGSEYKKGFASPTADEIDYIIGQYTGGVGREIMKAIETAKGAFTGEEVPPHRKPVIGKVLGDINTPQAITGRFYRNITEMAQHENEVKGRGENEGDVQEYFSEYPEARLFEMANDVENEVNEINREIKQLRKRQPDNKETIKNLEESKIRLMDNFNKRVREAREEAE